MELRLLTTEAERRVFAGRLVQAREANALGFRETRGSVIGEIHLSFGRLYGVFDEDSEDPNEMLAGIIMHCLGSFAQSYPKPDMTHLPLDTVFEVGELWSRAKGAGLIARRGAVILLGLFQAQALLAYPIVKPWDLTEMYRDFFTPVGEPIEWPYAEALDGQKIFVQALVSEGAQLRGLVGRAWSAGFRTYDRHRRIRFENPFAIRPTLHKEPEAIAKGSVEEANGTAPAQ